MKWKEVLFLHSERRQPVWLKAMELSKKYDVQLPIIEQVNEVLFDGKPADQAVKELMLRDKKLEVSHLPWPEE